MRTTIDIPEPLLRRVKAEAALQGLRLKDFVRHALQRHLADGRHPPEPAGVSVLDAQELGANCTFPLITGAAGPAMRELGGDGARKLLDEEDIDREFHSR